MGVTFASLSTLTDRFTGGAPGASLAAKLSNASDSMARGNVTAANNLLDAYQHEIAAQAGKLLTAAQAEVLSRLAQALKK